MHTNHWSQKLKGIALAACAIIAMGAPRTARSQSSAAKPSATEPQPAAALPLDHVLSLYNTHTNERISVVYRHGDAYVAAALSKLDYFLRDHNTNEVRHFDPHLYDILSDLTASVGHPGGEIDIVCGYRTPATNAALRERTNGVAKNSLHIQAEAIDLRMPGVNTLKLRRAALALARGGVGYYPHSDFIHVDVGRVRQWCFDCPANLATGD
ncbi:MAG: DUF882 domain-containing protein [Candidatus Acidiferrales bacterium]|jgi:uncharacterized protein YcbK (DUF882 family)